MSRFLDLVNRTAEVQQVEEIKEEPVAEVIEDKPATPKKTRKRTKKG